jgi:hypothetical protein
MMILQHSGSTRWFVDGASSACGAKLFRTRHPGRLTISAGRAWITRVGDLDDHVLDPGQVLALRADEEVVVEPWVNGSLVRLAWRSDQRPALLARVADSLAAAARRLAATGSRAAVSVRDAVVKRLAARARNAAASDKRAHGAIAGAESSASCGAVQ